jgi:crotonyl-CoA carboxylase/reductase
MNSAAANESHHLHAIATPPVVDVGTTPELGVVPERMHAWVIRPERFGEPRTSFVEEEIETWEPRHGEVLVWVMAAGVNYNGIWAGRGAPVDPTKVHGLSHHIAGSDASGVIWKIGPGVTGWKVGDEVVLHCNQTCGQCAQCNGGQPLACARQQIWGYETPDGSFAQVARAQAQQLLPKPTALTWEEAASYGLTYFTAYRMLVDRAALRAGEDVLVWGGAGGLGVFAIQIAKLAGARAIAVVSSDDKADLARELGAFGVIDRRDFPSIQYPKELTPESEAAWRGDVKRFGRAIWDVLGEKKGPDVVFEHVGRATFPASVFLANRFGRIVICGATTGYDLSFDVRHLWMHQKSIIGSHFADAGEANRANRLVESGLVRPVLTRTFTWDEVPEAHELMSRNELHGTVACLVGAPAPGLVNLRETLAHV